MFKRIFEKNSLVKHVEILMLNLATKVHDFECLVHKYKHIAQFLVNYSTEYQYMALYINGINKRIISVMNEYNVVYNVFVKMNLHSKTTSFLKQMVNEILYVDTKLTNEFEEVDEHYKIRIKPHYIYVKQSDLFYDLKL